MTLNFKKIRSVSLTAKKMVILSHGYGSDCEDLLSIGDYWKKFFPDFCFVAPNAPTICQINKSGYEWFDLMQTSSEKIIKEFEEALFKFDQFVNEQLEEEKLLKKDLFLMGFSQGTMMSLQSALTSKEKIAGVLGYSGKIYDFDFLKKNIISKPPVILFHGNTDTIIPLEEMYTSYEFLKRQSINVQYKVFENCSHSITPDGLSFGLDFIKSKINK